MTFRPELIKTYGNQGITGFLRMTGAVKAAGSAEKVTYYEEARLHQTVRATAGAVQSSAAGTDEITFTVDADTATFEAGVTADVKPKIVMKGDILLFNGKDRYIVVTRTLQALPSRPLL